jgi:hypothetical protein
MLFKIVFTKKEQSEFLITRKSFPFENTYAQIQYRAFEQNRTADLFLTKEVLYH